MSFEKGPKGSDGGRQAHIWINSLSSERNCKCKGPEAPQCLVCLRAIKQVSVAWQREPESAGTWWLGVTVRRGPEGQIKVFGFHSERCGNSLERWQDLALFLRITLATALRIIWGRGATADAGRPNTIINPGKTWWQLGVGSLSLGQCEQSDFCIYYEDRAKGIFWWNTCFMWKKKRSENDSNVFSLSNWEKGLDNCWN